MIQPVFYKKKNSCKLFMHTTNQELPILSGGLVNLFTYLKVHVMVAFVIPI